MENIKIVEKVWGHEEWVINTDKYCGKKLVLNQGYQSSLHYHKEKDETFYVESGKVLLELDSQQIIMNPGDAQRILPNQRHRFSGLEKSVILEFSTTHDDNDVVRLKDSRKMG